MLRYSLLLMITLILISLLACHTQPDQPLTAAAALGDTLRVEALLARGADVNAADRSGETALTVAARAGHVDTVFALLKRGADPNRPGGVNRWTPLMHAIHKHQRGSVLALLEGGADVNAAPRRETALMMAAGYGYAEIVRDLLAHGADPYAEDAHGDNALTVAVSGVPDIDRFTLGSCQTETVKVLLEKAPNLKIKDNAWGQLARWVAQSGRCSEVLKLLERPKQSASVH